MVSGCGLYFLWPLSCQHSNVSQLSSVLRGNAPLPPSEYSDSGRLHHLCLLASASPEKLQRAFWFLFLLYGCRGGQSSAEAPMLIPALVPLDVHFAPSHPWFHFHIPCSGSPCTQNFPRSWMTTASLCSTLWTQSCFCHASWSSAAHPKPAPPPSTPQFLYSGDILLYF